MSNTELVLKGAYATQQFEDRYWTILNSEGIEIGQVNNVVDEATVMSVIKLGRKYEHEAFEKGSNEGKQVMLAANRQRMIEQDALIKGLMGENERLSDKLEQLICD